MYCAETDWRVCAYSSPLRLVQSIESNVVLNLNAGIWLAQSAERFSPFCWLTVAIRIELVEGLHVLCGRHRPPQLVFTLYVNASVTFTAADLQVDDHQWKRQTLLVGLSRPVAWHFIVGQVHL